MVSLSSCLEGRRALAIPLSREACPRRDSARQPRCWKPEFWTKCTQLGLLPAPYDA